MLLDLAVLQFVLFCETSELEKLRVLMIVSGYYDVDKNFKVRCYCLVEYHVQMFVVIISYMRDNWSDDDIGRLVLLERIDRQTSQRKIPKHHS